MKTYKSNTQLNAIRKSGVVGTELKRNIDTMEDRERRDFINSRRLHPMDGRYKIGMCAYGSCREEFYLKGENGCGGRKYCKSHSQTVILIGQQKWRDENKFFIKARNQSWHKKRPTYQAEYYQKTKADRLSYAKEYREKNKEAIKAGRELRGKKI